MRQYDGAIKLFCFCVNAAVASESNLQNKRLKLDYDEITPCLKEVTLIWEKMLATPERPKVKVDLETIRTALAKGKTHLDERVVSKSSCLL